jgi:hypothetical protein
MLIPVVKAARPLRRPRTNPRRAGSGSCQGSWVRKTNGPPSRGRAAGSGRSSGQRRQLCSRGVRSRPPRSRSSEQLSILENEIRNGRGNVEIQIAPLSLAIPMATRRTFVLMRMPGSQSDVVYIEDLRYGGDFMAKPDDYARFEAEFAVLKANALGRDESLTLIQKLIGE